jgi:hypothetical protein
MVEKFLITNYQVLITKSHYTPSCSPLQSYDIIKKMKRGRLIFFFSSLAAILIVTFLVIKLAQGYRPDIDRKTLRPTGLLVATSLPDGAQLWLEGKLVSATNTTLNLSPDEYQVEIKKDGFSSWKKKLKIEKELVTKTDAYLFPTFPDLKALTFTGAASPLLSPDGQKVVFAVSGASPGKNGLWILDLADRPLGLSREPRQIVQSAPKGRDFAKSEYLWSPDSKQILVTLLKENFLLDSERLNPATDLIDVTDNLVGIKRRWQEEEKIRQDTKLSKLPPKLLEAINDRVADIQFAPDETKILYTATASASIPQGIIPPLPASNTQPESRSLEPGKIYVYDLKEDKNFLIGNYSPEASWFPTSKHIFLVQKDKQSLMPGGNKISIVEYDGTNLVDVYSGPFENSFAFPFPAGNRLLVLTSIGKDTPPNLYAISLR